MATTRQSKREMRRATIESILALTPDQRSTQQSALEARLPSLPGWDTAQTVLLYASVFPEEIDTRTMLELAIKTGKRLVCPVVDRSQRRLRLHAVGQLDRDLRSGELGIPEPDSGSPEVSSNEVDWVMVPGLAFDDRGYRLGRGGGYYDRLLPTLRPDAPRWALAFDPQWVDRVPTESHDQRLTGIVSPSREFVAP